MKHVAGIALALVAAAALAGWGRDSVDDAGAATWPPAVGMLAEAGGLPEGHPPVPPHDLALPEGHPPVLPPGHPPVMPPGHPPVPGSQPRCPARDASPAWRPDGFPATPRPAPEIIST